MHFLSTKPILKILVNFIAGILLYPVLDIYGVLSCSSVILLFLFFKKYFNGYLLFRFQFIYGFLIHLLLLSAGYLNMYLHDIRMNRNWFAKGNAVKQMIIKINGPVKKKDAYYHSTASVLYISGDSGWKSSKGNMAVHFPAEIDPPFNNAFYYVNAEIQPIPPSKKSATFDFRTFMARRNIYHGCYPTVQQLQKLHHYEKISFFQRFTDELRKKILGIIDRYITAQGENGLAKALLIGYRDNLDRDIIAAYTNTGVIHVIAISGLHLGLIYALLAYLLKSFQKKNYLSTYRSVFIASFLWIFSILCGASPSVLRSALMFTCLLAGEAMRKENHTANALAASAFILLCFDPMLLWDIGFQLSYAAVGSLLIYNRLISRLYSSGNIILSFAWNSVSTSISAQILTTPLILYHFHQFPVLFILSNLIAVPLSGIILMLLILLCIISPLRAIAIPLAHLTSWLSLVMNVQIQRLNRISFGVVSNIDAGSLDTILFYVLIAFMSIWLVSKKSFMLFAILFLILLWIILAKSGCG
jgi:competence protein ComEC